MIGRDYNPRTLNPADSAGQCLIFSFLPVPSSKSDIRTFNPKSVYPARHLQNAAVSAENGVIIVESRIARCHIAEFRGCRRHSRKTFVSNSNQSKQCLKQGSAPTSSPLHPANSSMLCANARTLNFSHFSFAKPGKNRTLRGQADVKSASAFQLKSCRRDLAR
jgi:hypothetical protein